MREQRVLFSVSQSENQIFSLLIFRIGSGDKFHEYIVMYLPI